MAFVKKTWKDRIAEFPTRRRLTKEDNTSELVTVAREEGTLSQEGDAFSAENMNDLENRIDEEFTAVNGNLSWKLLKSVTGTENVNISGIIYDELCIICKRANVAVQFLIPKSCLNSEVTQFENGGISSTKNIALLATSEYIALNYWYLGNTKYTSDVTTIIYYK